MPSDSNLFMYMSKKTKGMFCFSGDSRGEGLPPSFAPWVSYGVLRRDQTPPHGLSRQAIEAGVRENGYQLWREKPKHAAASQKN